MIPKIINHIWLQGENEIPKKYDSNRKLWKDLHPDWNFIIWNEKDTIKLINDKLPAYLKFIIDANNLINKVNVIKYLNLYFFGGVYCDLDTYPIKSLNNLFEETDLGNINLYSRLSDRYPYNIQNINKNLGKYDIIIPSRSSFIFYPNGDKIIMFDNPILIAKPFNIFWLKLIEYCSQRTDLKSCEHEPFGPFGLTEFVYKNYYNVNEHNIAILPSYFMLSPNNDDKYIKRYIVHEADYGWK